MIEAYSLSDLGTNLSHPFIGNISAITEEKDYFTFVNTAEAYYKSQEIRVLFSLLVTVHTGHKLKNILKKKD